MKLKIFAIILTVSSVLSGQYNGKRFSIGVNAVYTTTSKIYLSPNSSDLTVRNSYVEMGEILNPAVEFKYRLTDEIILGFGTEYIKKTRTTTSLPGLSGIPVNDGFSMIPLELSIYYLIPFSTENFKFLMGGGGGFYYGEHIREVGDAEVSNLERKTAYGIHVIIAMDYLVRDNISVHGEMKFRDPQFNVTSSYNKSSIIYNNRFIPLQPQAFASKINIDGVSFLIGLAFLF
ncbi:MAG: hypothetical protein R6W90_09975 [Ignavibacteriaceae bacterium]